MSLKLNISDKGKAWKLELEHGEALFGKNVGDKINGGDVKPELEGYELEITGGSDIAGFPMSKQVEGIGLRGVLLKKGWGMHDKRKGVRLRKSVRGKTISEAVVQLNLNVLKHGAKKLEEVFPEQVSSPQGEAPQQGEEAHSKSESDLKDKKEEKKQESKEVKQEEKKEEIKQDKVKIEEKKEEVKEEEKSDGEE